MFPALGFGAQLPPDWKVSVCIDCDVFVCRTQQGRTATWVGCHVQAHSQSKAVLHMYFTHTDKTVSIIRAYSDDYATVNPSVLPWRWADEKGQRRSVQRWREEGRGNMWEKWTVFFTAFYYWRISIKRMFCCLCRCHMNSPSTLTPPTLSVQVSCRVEAALFDSISVSYHVYCKVHFW